jgi:hypothetical protein
MDDRRILNHIEEMIAAEQKLYGQSHLTESEKLELEAIQIELDQYWDLLRQRRALRDAGKNPEKAHLRGPDIVENYEQ